LALLATLSMSAAEQAMVPPFEDESWSVPLSAVDTHVWAALQARDIEPAHPCSDVVFVRRVYLDAIGTLPKPAELREFLTDPRPGKRAALIDALLEREEFADYWALKWCDLLRVKAEFPIKLWPNAAQAYHHWVRESIRLNKPYDQFVRELLTSSGSNFRVAPVNFYRAIPSRTPEGIARTVALTFMGTRLEKWPGVRQTDMAKFFSLVGYKATSEWKEEIVFFDVVRARALPAGTNWLAATFPDGSPVKADPLRDGRHVFADWLITADNPWFTRSIVNRAWSWFMGRGIIHEPDDIRPDNPPCNPALLAYLEHELAASRYDLKHIFRLILNSRTYQLSSIPQANPPSDAAGFAYYPQRRLEAEVLIDALCQVTATTETYVSPIPEPFTYIPPEHRSITLPDGSITSSFLDLFGRPARDTGMESERNNSTTAAQRLHLLNSGHIQNKIEKGPGLQALMKAGQTPAEFMPALYLTILSRYPTEEELRTVNAYANSGPSGERNVAVDVAWALINSTEFLYRH
jgi:hypothetical protein